MRRVFSFMSSIKTDFSSLENTLKNATADTMAAATQAVNTATELGRIEAANHISARYSLPGGYVQSRLKISKYASESNLTTVIQARTRATKLNEFKHHQKFKRGKTVSRKAAGVEVKVKTNGLSFYWDNAFFIDLRNGNRGLAVRKRGGGRNDIKVLYSASVGFAFRHVRDAENLPEKMLRTAKKEFFKYLGV